MRGLYNRLLKLLDKVDFDNIWHGFHKFEFALYNDETVYMYDKEIPYDDRFLGNTAIEFDGKNIAIWCMDGISTIDEEELVSKLVHEMFHAFQKEIGETRFPRDLVTLSYPMDTKNFELKHAENIRLANAYDETVLSNKINLLKEFISIRRQREKLIGNMIFCEYLSETAEGIAEYVGNMALKQLSKAKYDKLMKKNTELLRKVDNILFDVRKISYYSGAVFLAVLKDSGIDFYHMLNEKKVSVFEMIRDRFHISTEIIIEPDMVVIDQAKSFICERDKKFADFFSKKHQRKETHCRIVGYDPMNMIKHDNQILCTHFIILAESEESEHMFIKGPVVVELMEGSLNIANAYYI